jgi:hypothetical protein
MIPNPPLCIHCSHFLSGDGGKNEVQAEHRCAKFPVVDLVTGIRFNMECNVVRSPEAPCGEEGKLFQPLDDLDKPKAIEPNKTPLF